MIRKLSFSEIHPGDSWWEGNSKLTAIKVAKVDGGSSFVRVTYSKEDKFGKSHLQTSDIRQDMVWDIDRPEPEATKEELDQVKQGLESWLQ